jgi:hypothetical protein
MTSDHISDVTTIYFMSNFFQLLQNRYEGKETTSMHNDLRIIVLVQK